MGDHKRFALHMFLLYEAGTKLSSPRHVGLVEMTSSDSQVYLTRVPPIDDEDELLAGVMAKPYETRFDAAGVYVIGMDMDHKYQEWLLTTLTPRQLSRIDLWW